MAKLPVKKSLEVAKSGLVVADLVRNGVNKISENLHVKFKVHIWR